MMMNPILFSLAQINHIKGEEHQSHNTGEVVAAFSVGGIGTNAVFSLL